MPVLDLTKDQLELLIAIYNRTNFPGEILKEAIELKEILEKAMQGE